MNINGTQLWKALLTSEKLQLLSTVTDEPAKTVSSIAAPKCISYHLKEVMRDPNGIALDSVGCD